MTRQRKPSIQTVAVLRELAAHPTEWRYGYDLNLVLSMKSGSLYPILIRLADRGLLETEWEAAVPGKPPRHLYRLTQAGLDEAARASAENEAVPAATPLRQLRRA